MKNMKIKKKKTFRNIHYAEFHYKNICGTYYNDKSGSLTIETYDGDGIAYYDYFSDDGKFNHKLREVKRLAEFYTKAYKNLLVVDKKLKTIKLKPDEN